MTQDNFYYCGRCGRRVELDEANYAGMIESRLCEPCYLIPYDLYNTETEEAESVYVHKAPAEADADNAELRRQGDPRRWVPSPQDDEIVPQGPAPEVVAEALAKIKAELESPEMAAEIHRDPTEAVDHAVRENWNRRKGWGGPRPGSGRPERDEPKAAPIWIGQISEEDREFILENLTPDERFAALKLAAIKKTKNPDGGGIIP